MSTEKIVVNDKDYTKLVSKAVKSFWNTKKRQLKDSGDASNRGAVVGGKQMDGFIDLLKKVATDVGVPAKCIITKQNYEPHFSVRSEFNNASYLDRYRILCQKLILERHYTSTALLWTSDANIYGDLSAEISVQSFINSFSGYLNGVKDEFK
jgi:hypothetical protein